jgi:diaminopimelate decarboxylase
VNRSEFCSIVGRDDFERAVRAAATPAFLYFARVVRKRHADLVGCLPASFHVYYAVKANPNPFLLRELSSMGVGADVASTGELNAAVANGISPDRIEFSGPGKSAREIADAIRLGVSSINAESLPELESIARASSQGGIRARAGVRINPGVSPTEAGLQMAGATQFGIPICQLEEALQFIRANPDTIEFTGLHVHAGSQLLSSAAVAQNFRSILDLAMRIVDLGILPLRKINFGGGWGVTYFPHQTPVDLADLSVGLADVFTQKAYAELRDVRHIVEPGWRVWSLRHERSVPKAGRAAGVPDRGRGHASALPACRRHGPGDSAELRDGCRPGGRRAAVIRARLRRGWLPLHTSGCSRK